jgi:hypothetical protein
MQPAAQLLRDRPRSLLGLADNSDMLATPHHKDSASEGYPGKVSVCRTQHPCQTRTSLKTAHVAIQLTYDGAVNQSDG